MRKAILTSAAAAFLAIVCFIAMPIGDASDTKKGSKDAVTFNKDVAPIFYANCVQCHRAGEIAPMSLMTYKEARPWARSIREKVTTREMPPWHADPRHGAFSNDRRLAQKDVDTILAWVEQGTPEGSPKDLPPAPKFAEGWNIGKPDAVFYLPQEFTVPAEGVVEYKYFTVPTKFTEDKWVQAAEIRPGDRRLVHHIIVNVQDPNTKESGPEAGGNQAERGFKLAGFAPGEQPKVFPPGTAKLVKAGSNLIFQMHYTPNGEAGKDRSYIGLIFATGPIQKKVLTATATNARFVIPAGDPNYEVRSSWTAKEDVEIVDLMPHMHVRGKDFIYTAVYPDGRSEVVLSVPKYDFNWQLLYRLKQPLFLPKGSRLDCVAHFDNSTGNKYNPDPTTEVRWGPQTWEEMMIGWFDYTLANQHLLPQAASK